MKYLAALVVLCLSLTASAQHSIYYTDGAKQPGKIVEITADRINYKKTSNLNGPTYSSARANVAFAFNANGDFLVFDDRETVGDREKMNFIGAVYKPRATDVLVDTSGTVTPVVILSETEEMIVCKIKDGKQNVLKPGLSVVIRTNGTHQLIGPVTSVLSVLQKIGKKTSSASAQTPVAAKSIEPANPEKRTAPAGLKEAPPAKKPVAKNAANLEVDEALFTRKAKVKVGEFTDYVQIIIGAKENIEYAKKSVNNACNLFTDDNSRVEVSSVNTAATNKYKVRDYLNRLILRSGQFDKIYIKYAQFNYVSKFTKGTDGNYHGVVTFVQKFEGFADGKMVYVDETKRNVAVIIKQYEKEVNGESVAGWEVFLGDIGVVETKRI